MCCLGKPLKNWFIIRLEGDLKTIPDIILSKNSRAEVKIFHEFKQVDIGNNWQVYHSLNCSEHEYKRWSEIDFLVVGPDGLFVLEVKGGRVKCNDGIWIYTDRNNQEYIHREGPFKQAETAMRALRKMLKEKYDLPDNIIDKMNFGWGVVFPDIEWAYDAVEMPLDVVADKSDFASTRMFEKYLIRLKDYWLAKEKRSSKLSSTDLNLIKTKLRPDVDVYPPFSVKLGHALEEMARLTEEQYERLEIIEANDTAIISGGAGTGKTFLMVQCARREIALGGKCLIVVESRIFAAHLKGLIQDEKIVVSAYDHLRRSLGTFDVLLIDEGQDLLNLDVFTKLTEYLLGGIENGRWRWFMDENNQANISGNYDPDALNYLREGLGGNKPVRLPLVRNIRTTKEIAEKINNWTLSDIGRPEVTGWGSPPDILMVDAEEDLLEKIINKIGDLNYQDIDFNKIGIVYPYPEMAATLQKLPRNIRRKLVPLDTTIVSMELSNSIVHGTAAEFKGLERPVLLAIGFEGEAFAGQLKNILYTALTRCNIGLYLFIDLQLMAALKNNEDKAILCQREE
jgi:hypothetical protein